MTMNILPLLRLHNIAYRAYCPLAAGFLTGNFTRGEYAGTRFASDHPLHEIFWRRYDNENLHNAVRRIESLGKAFGGITVREVALRWAFHHSCLSANGDGIIMGCTSVAQIEENVITVKQGPLPQEMCNLLNDIWESLEESRKDII
ncbi:Aflatoxin B1 aldehyde reductase member 3 [Talaromyces pinophilus]|nr:Aflatoxin B1 aldehyde reductase member 3 [Talaromyces pinophilus]